MMFGVVFRVIGRNLEEEEIFYLHCLHIVYIPFVEVRYITKSD